MIFVQLVIATGGIILTFFTAGLAAPAAVAAGGVLGGALTGAGIQSLQHTVNEKSVVTGECDTKQQFLKVGIGFVQRQSVVGSCYGSHQ